MKLRVIFFGSPALAVPFLNQVFETEQVVGVVTRQDKPSGRGHHVCQTSVAEAAQGKVEIRKPVKLNDPDFYAWVNSLKADLGIVVAYGRILPEKLISVPPMGCVNIHFSLLPRYRGAAPIQHAILNGETETGVTAFLLSKDIDTGPVLVREAIPVQPDDTTATLTPRLIRLGKKVLDETIGKLKKGRVQGMPQTGTPTYAPLIKKEQGIIDWEKTAAGVIKNKIRALIGWPCAYTHLPDGKILKITGAELCEPEKICEDSAVLSPRPGAVTHLVKGKGFIVKCFDTSLLVTCVIPEGRKEMSGEAFINGRGIKVGDVLN